MQVQRRNVLISVASALTLAPLAGRARQQGSKSRVVPAAFESAGARLVGDLHLPAGEPQGAIVLVHGSGARPRIDWAARYFAQRGLAVLTYDKRGVGASGGTFEGQDNASHTNLALLAGDAAAAMQFLRHRPEVKGCKLGYWGISQAGRVIPLAVVQSEPIDFFALWSGQACTAIEELEAEAAASGNARLQGYVDYLKAKSLDTDPRDSLRRIKAAGLWIFGGRDTVRTGPLSIERLKALIEAGQGNFTYWLNSAGGHDDFDANPWFMDAATQWMLTQARCR